MMGEEGYDHLRDMGRIRKNKKKKDATTMPPSKEMEKTRKVNKGPSALDIVKKKYKGQIMKMEELDLTQVAEAFGGFVIESKAKITKVGKKTIIGPTRGAAGRESKVVKKFLDKIETAQKPKRVTNRMAKTFAGQDIERMTGDKFVAGTNLENTGKKRRRKLQTDPSQLGKASEVKIIQKGVKKPKVTVVQTGVKSPKFKKPEDIKGTARQFVKDLGTTGEKQTPETKKELEKIKSNQNKGPNQNPEFTKLIGDKKRRQDAYDAYDDSDSGRPQTGNTLNNTKNTNKNQQTFDQMFKDVRKRQSGEKPVIDDPFGETKTKTKTKQLPPPEKITTKIKSGKVTGDVENLQGPKKPIRDRNRVLQKVRVAARKTKRPVQRLAKPLGKLAARNPFAAAIVGTDLLDRAGRMIPKPKPPKLDVGVVGRRTAG
jgi:hypothetical protein